MNKTLNILLRALFLAACMISASGCVSSAGRIPEITLNSSASRVPQKTALINVSYEMQYFTDTAPRDNAILAQSFRSLLSETLHENPVFESFTFNEGRGSNADFRVKIAMKNIEHGSMWGVVLCAGTLTVLPGTSRNDFTLTINVDDAAGKPIKKYSYEDSCRTWIELLLLPCLLSETPDAHMRDQQKNMIKAWLKDLLSDEITTRPQ